MSVSKEIADKYEKEYHTGLIEKDFGGFSEDHWVNNEDRWNQTAEMLDKHFLSSYLKSIRRPIRILEVGTGYGTLLTKIEKLSPHYKVFGFDISGFATKKGRSLYGLNLLRACASKLPFKNNSIDIIIAFDVLEHLPYETHFKSAISDIYRILVPYGKLLVTIPLKNRDGTENILETEGVMEHYVVMQYPWWAAKLKEVGLKAAGNSSMLEDKDKYPFNMSPYNYFMHFTKVDF